MSRVLPAHPNLEHLKKQAKELLRDRQQRNPASKLADAQHTIAREYGFASWSELKARVESIAAEPWGAGGGGGGGGAAVSAGDGPPPNDVFHRYTERARRALFFARYEASELGSPFIETEHLLLALIREGEEPTSRIFAPAHVSLDNIRADVRARTVAREKLPSSVMIPLSDETKRILRCAADEADRLRHHDITTAHLLLGIVCEKRSMAASLLVEKGMRLRVVRDEIVHALRGETM